MFGRTKRNQDDDAMDYKLRDSQKNDNHGDVYDNDVHGDKGIDSSPTFDPAT